MRDRNLLSSGLVRNKLRRFWPLWLLYFVVLALVFVAPTYADVTSAAASPGTLADKVSLVSSFWVLMRLEALFVCAIASAIVAISLNEQLFSSSAATFAGALPLRRRTVFASGYVAGLVALLAVPAASALCVLPLCAIAGIDVFSPPLVLEWYALMACLSFVFYSIAQLSCQLAGAAPIATLLYGVINLLAICLQEAVAIVISALMYGISSWSIGCEWLSPVAGIVSHGLGFGIDDEGVQWAVIAGYCVAAALVTVVSDLLFERRDLEVAGSSIAFPVLCPVLKYLAGVSTALLFSTIYCMLTDVTYASSAALSPMVMLGLCASMSAGAFLGVLFSEMIMSRSTHVLGRCWRGGLVLVAMVIAFVVACRLDVLGVAHRVPSVSQVDDVRISLQYFDDETELSSEDSVSSVIELHRDILAYGDAGYERKGGSYVIHIAYDLTDGRTIERSYMVATRYPLTSPNERDDDVGTNLVWRYAAIADSTEGRASRYDKLMERAKGLDVRIEFYGDADGQLRVITLPASEREELVSGALRHDMLEEPAGASLTYDDEEQEQYETLLPAILSIEGEYTSCLYLQLGEQTTPATVSWVREHYPELLLAP